MGALPSLFEKVAIDGECRQRIAAGGCELARNEPRIPKMPVCCMRVSSSNTGAQSSKSSSVSCGSARVLIGEIRLTSTERAPSCRAAIA